MGWHERQDYWLTVKDVSDWLVESGFDVVHGDVAIQPGNPAVASVRKASALRDELSATWPSIKQDMSEASRNGLSAARVPGAHGMWYVDRVLEWGNERGKVQKAKPAATTIFNSKVYRAK